MKKTLFTIAFLITITLVFAQDEHKERVIITNSSSTYPGLVIRAHDGSNNVPTSHPFIAFNSSGGTETNLLPIPANRVLGSLIFSGYDGNNNFQAARIQVDTKNTFSTSSHLARMNFRIGGFNTGITRMSIDGETGNVGIGTTDTKGFKLGVQGKIAATEVKIAAYANWTDFVFENNYNLPTLKEVEQHIKRKGHLKDIPSAKEVKKDGFFLGEMDAKLLQKIEELTLYTIQLQKEIKKQEKEIERLKLIEKRIAEIEKTLDQNK